MMTDIPENVAVIAEIVHPEPVEIVQIAIPVLCEAIAAIFAIGVAMMWVIILATEIPA